MQTLIYFAGPIAIVLAAVAIFRRVSAGDGSVANAQTGARAGSTNSDSARQGSGAMRPVLDVGLCMGSGGCVRACPHGALGMVRGRAVLASPNLCLGHGACAAACPAEAISFVPGVPQANPAAG